MKNWTIYAVQTITPQIDGLAAKTSIIYGNTKGMCVTLTIRVKINRQKCRVFKKLSETLKLRENN